jgi:hypothetical protein
MSRNNQTKIVVNVSGGSASAVAYLRCLDRFSADRVVGVFADTRSEHPDLYRVLNDLEKHTGTTLVRLDKGMNIWECFNHFGVMTLPNGACKASVELKQKMLANWTRKHYTPDHALFGQRCVIAAGMEYSERLDRQKRLSERLKPYRVIYPLNWRPVLTKCQIHEHLIRIGITPGHLYTKGYGHDNCGGGCVLAGQKQWAMLLADDPDQYAYHEAEEAKFYAKTGYTILNDRRGDGKKKRMSLTQFRERVAAGEVDEGDFRSGCSCMFVGDDEPVRLV